MKLALLLASTTLLTMACETKKQSLPPESRELRLCGTSSQNLCDAGESDVILSAPSQANPEANDDVTIEASVNHLVDADAPVVLLTGMRDYANYSADVTNPEELDGCLANVKIVKNVVIFKMAESDWQQTDEETRSWIKNCLVNLDLAYLEGFQFTVDRIETNIGIFAQENSLSGRAKLLYSVTGETSSLSLDRSLNSDTSLTVAQSFVDDIWSSCSGEETIGLKSIFSVTAESAYRDDNPAQADYDIVGPEQSSQFFFDKGIVAVSLRWRAC